MKFHRIVPGPLTKFCLWLCLVGLYQEFPKYRPSDLIYIDMLRNLLVTNCKN